MRKIIVFIFIVLSFVGMSFSQSTGITVELHYPITGAHENNNYSDVTGIFGAGFQFQFSDAEFVNYGLEYKFDLNQTYQRYEGSASENINFMMNHLNGFAKINLDLMQKTKVYTNAGFTFYKYKGGQSQQGFTGFNAGAGLSYEFVEKFYAQASYNYIKAGLKQKQTGFVDSETFSTFRIGIGFKL